MRKCWRILTLFCWHEYSLPLPLHSTLSFAFHIIFPAFTIGLASWLAVVEWRWLKTGNDIYQEVYRMWVKIFAVTFGMGVVSGVVMSFQFGTNWSVFSDKVGNIFGPLLGFEVLTAFFLEASFLGIMLFGWNRVSRKMHFASTIIVACGTLISAFWILSANRCRRHKVSVSENMVYSIPPTGGKSYLILLSPIASCTWSLLPT